MTMIFPNLAVSDLPRSVAFYSALGFERNPQFSNEESAAMVVNDEIVVMLLSPAFAEQNGMILPQGRPSMSLAVSRTDRTAVDAITEKALSAGAATRGETTNLGFMYSRGITDPDGHYWDFLWMDPSAV